jgi:hypothetical protein
MFFDFLRGFSSKKVDADAIKIATSNKKDFIIKLPFPINRKEMDNNTQCHKYSE